MAPGLARSRSGRLASRKNPPSTANKPLSSPSAAGPAHTPSVKPSKMPLTLEQKQKNRRRRSGVEVRPRTSKRSKATSRPQSRAQPAINPLTAHRLDSLTFEAFSPTKSPHAAQATRKDSGTAESPIGMALGSPREDLSWVPQRPYDSRQNSCTTASRSPSDSPSKLTVSTGLTTPDEAEHKTSKWRTLGGLFGRKASLSPAPSPLHQVRHPSPIPPQQNEYLAQKVLPAPPKPSTDRQRNPPPVRAHTVPEQSPASSSTVDSSTPSHLRHRPLMTAAAAAARPQPRFEGRSLLDIEIPNIELERYSVMFGSLLEQPRPASSLLARRQVNLERLHTSGVAATPRRPATSPTTTRSKLNISTSHQAPRKSSTSDNDEAAPRRTARSPLHRALTSPGRLSPNTEAGHFDTHVVSHARKPRDESHFVMMVHDASDLAPADAESKRPSFTASTSRLSISSHEEGFEDLRKDSTLIMGDTQQRGRDAKRSTSRSRSPSEAEALIRHAAAASIARQISVSQRQRLLLSPDSQASAGHRAVSPANYHPSSSTTTKPSSRTPSRTTSPRPAPTGPTTVFRPGTEKRIIADVPQAKWQRPFVIDQRRGMTPQLVRGGSEEAMRRSAVGLLDTA
ncbi:MAG: hypothetical protein M1817_002791 [Caeruleum heppii]|nr:MAG: hypothetical protein M1817_002791 [Caeruleum heppii]